MQYGPQLLCGLSCRATAVTVALVSARQLAQLAQNIATREEPGRVATEGNIHILCLTDEKFSRRNFFYSVSGFYRAQDHKGEGGAERDQSLQQNSELTHFSVSLRCVRFDIVTFTCTQTDGEVKCLRY